MADYISQITLPNNVTYDLKDAASARGNGRVFYGTCATAAGTVPKEVICNQYDTLTIGDILIVKFANTNSATANDNLKLQIKNTSNGTTTEAKAIKQQYNSTGNNNLNAVEQLNANGISAFVYNGTYWILLNGNYNNTYTITSVWCNTAAATAAKTFSNASYYAANNKSYFEITFRYANSAQSALTLNGKTLYINGTASSASNYTIPAGKYLVYYDNNIYYIRTDGKITGDITGDAATVNGLTVQTAVPENAKFTDTNKYHKSGSWSGLTYTATAVNSADELKFTIPDNYGDTKNPYGTKVKNLILAGPASGNNAAPSFRKLVAADIPDLSWNKITSDIPTTLSGYGITDAKIASGVITLGSNTITPVTSVNGNTGDVTITAESLNLSKAMRFIGVATVDITDESTTDPKIENYTTKTAGDVIIDKESSREYVWSTTGKWELLGGDSSYKVTQTAVTTATAETIEDTVFVSSVTQNENGEITVKTRPLDTSGTWEGNADTASSAAKLSTACNLGVALDSTTAVTFDGSANQTSIPVSGTLGIAHGGTGQTTLTAARQQFSGPEFIVGTWTAASGTWTGTTTDSELYDGKQIILYMPFAGHGNATLNLTLADGTTTGAKNVYFESTTPFTTHKGQNAQLHLIYHSALTLSNGNTYEGWWYIANRDTDNDYRVKQTIVNTNNTYSLLFSDRVTGAATNNTAYITHRNDLIYVNPSLGAVYATSFHGALTGNVSGNADTATAAHLTTTTNAIAYYTNTTGTFGSKASANGALYATSTNGALQWGILPIAQGGTNKSEWTNFGIVYTDSDGFKQITAGAADNNQQVLISNGAAAPNWYSGLSLAGTAEASYIATFKGTTASTSTTTGAVTIAGGLGVAGRITASEINATRKMVVSAGKVYSNISGSNVLIPAKTSMLFSDGIAFASPGLTAANDVGWIRMLEEDENTSVLEIATGDDGEEIVVRQYNTSNTIIKEAILLEKATGATSFPVSVTAPTFIGDLTGNADTATKWASAQTVYVALGTASTTTTIQGGSTTAVALGVNGTLAVGHGGTGMTKVSNVNAVVIGNSSNVANALQTVRTASGAFYATAQDGKPTFGTLPVAQGGTGAASFTANSIIISGTTTTAALTTRAIKNMTSVSHLGWTTAAAGIEIPTVNTLAYWNGQYAKGSSNLQYCKLGQFGDMATKTASNYVLKAGDTMTGTLTIKGLKGTNNVDYGTALPTSGTAGQIFFQLSDPFYEIPAGGTTGQVLMKHSDSSRDVYWGTPSAGGILRPDTTTKYYVAGSTLTVENTEPAIFNTSVYVQNSVLFGAAWNDYAEYRQTIESIEPGRCVIEDGTDTLQLSSARMQAGAEIVSDTYGFAIGQTEKCNTPIAVTGRVLAYPYDALEKYKPGTPVCSGPDGTVSAMTEEEARQYPWLILGTVSAIPTYEEWGANHIKINGRIWIRIR